MAPSSALQVLHPPIHTLTHAVSSVLPSLFLLRLHQGPADIGAHATASGLRTISPWQGCLNTLLGQRLISQQGRQSQPWVLLTHLPIRLCSSADEFISLCWGVREANKAFVKAQGKKNCSDLAQFFTCLCINHRRPTLISWKSSANTNIDDAVKPSQ